MQIQRKLKRFLMYPPVTTAMKAPCRRLTNSLPRLLIFIFLVLIHIALVEADAFDTLTGQREVNAHWPLFDCPQCMDKKEVYRRLVIQKYGTDPANHPVIDTALWEEASR